jgi:hypothetical protein
LRDLLDRAVGCAVEYRVEEVYFVDDQALLLDDYAIANVVGLF